MIHQNLKLLSHSSTVLLHKCPRKYELYKMLPKSELANDGDDDAGGHLSFGAATGVGVQEYLRSDRLDDAIFKTFMEWNSFLDDDNGVRARKTFWHVVHAIERFTGFRHTALSGYDLVYFEDKPAIELGFQIDCGDGFFYRGFLDALLLHKMRNELAVYEGKTTRNKDIHDAMFKHSGQSLGYSVVIDSVARLIGKQVTSSFKVNYAVYKTFSYEWELMPFTKNFTHRAMWLKNLFLDKKRIIQYANDGYFPMYGENCFDFFRPCQYFGTCELSNANLIGPPEEVAEQNEDPDKYQFKFHINELIEAQLEAAKAEGE